MSKLSFLPPAFCLLLLVAVAGCSKKDANSGYETAKILRGDLTQKITASGSLSAAVSVDVGSQISGRIMKINVDYNSKVKKGEVIAELDPAIYQAMLLQAEGDLANSKAALELSELQLARTKSLREMNTAPQSNLDQALATMHQNQAIVKMKEGTLELARANLNNCTILSPIDCVVTARKVDVGQTVAASFNTPVLFTIANDLSKMQINSNVSEADIGQVAVGQKVEFTVDAYPDEIFFGTTLQIRKAPATIDNVVTYDTVIDVANPDLKLFPGMTTNLSIRVAERKNVLRIPNSALRFTPPDGTQLEENPAAGGGGANAEISSHQRLVYVRSGTDKAQKLRAIKIKVGISDGASTEILEGLTEGMEVVTASLQGTSSPGGHPPGP